MYPEWNLTRDLIFQNVRTSLMIISQVSDDKSSRSRNPKPPSRKESNYLRLVLYSDVLDCSGNDPNWLSSTVAIYVR